MPHLVPIGNSLGLRIPKAILAQLGFKLDTDLIFKVIDEGLLVSPTQHIRAGWAEAFKSACEDQKEPLLMEEYLANHFDEDEWEW